MVLMNKYCSIIFLGLFFITASNHIFAQDKLSSFYFKESAPKGMNELDTLLGEFEGVYYNSEDSLRWLIVEQDSIISQFNMYTFITEDDLKKKKGVRFDDGFLYGMMEDSLPAFVQNDTVFFGLPYRTNYFKPGINQHLFQLDSNQYLKSTKVSGKDLYTYTILTFYSDSLFIDELDHEVLEQELEVLGKIRSEKKEEFTTFIAKPDQKSLLEFLKVQGFRQRKSFIREN